MQLSQWAHGHDKIKRDTKRMLGTSRLYEHTHGVWSMVIQ